ncbi:MAG: hypothetical protein U1E53_09780 [Dongiaceae bacterium]
MTGVGLGDFRRVGLEARQGAIELTQDRGRQSLANVGTRWQRFTAGVTALFSSAADNARRQQQAQGRQQAALDTFRTLLSDRYGDTLAGVALGRAGLDAHGTTAMTWKQGRAAELEASRLIHQNHRVHQAFLLDHRVRGVDGEFSPAFREICAARGIDPSRLGKRQTEAYEQRFKEAFLARAEGGRNRVSYSEARQIAAKALADVQRLGSAGIDGAADARKVFVGRMTEAIGKLADGADGPTTVTALQTAGAALHEWMLAEGVDINQDTLKDFQQRGMDEAIRSLEPGARRRALANGLGSQGALRLVCTGADDRVRGNVARGGAMMSLSGMAQSLAAQLSLRAGPLGATRDEDIVRVSDDTGLASSERAKTGKALDQIADEAEAKARRAERQALVEAVFSGPEQRTQHLIELATAGNSILGEEFVDGALAMGQRSRIEFLTELRALQGRADGLRPDPDDQARLGEAINRFEAKWLAPPRDGEEPRVPLSDAARQAVRQALSANRLDVRAFDTAQSEVADGLDRAFGAGFIVREHAAFSPAQDAALQAAELRRSVRAGTVTPDKLAEKSEEILKRLKSEPNLQAGGPLGRAASGSFCGAMAELCAARLEANARSERPLDPKAVLDELRKEVRAQSIGPTREAKALSIVDKAEAQLNLEAEMARGGRLGDFPGGQAWRMVMDGHLQASRGEYGFENEQGYMAGMLNGLTLMLADARAGRALDATSYEQLHDACVRGVYSKPTIMPEKLEEGRLKTGYRTNDGTNVGVGYSLKPVNPEDPLRRGNVTIAGREQLERSIAEQGQPPWFRLALRARADAQDQVWSDVRSADQCRGRVNDIFNSYRAELARAGSEDDRLRAIARCCQALDQSHVFEDGNIRTVSFLVMNRLLIDNGLSPAILREPNMFDGYALDELVAEMREGQAQFGRVSRGEIA